MNGEFLAEIQRVGGGKKNKAGPLFELKELLRTIDSERPPSAVVFFAPIKKPRMKLLVEKATELGASAIVPVITQNTNIAFDPSFLETTTVEAAEQSERLSIPILSRPLSFEEFVCRANNIDSSSFCITDINGESKVLAVKGPIFACCEPSARIETKDLLSLLFNQKKNNKPYLESRKIDTPAIFVGPEGGFSDDELAQMSLSNSGFEFVSLGINVLRSETAVTAALSVINNVNLHHDIKEPF